MRTLTLAAATAGLVLLPTAAFAAEPADAVAAPARLTAFCDGAFTASASSPYATITFTAAAFSYVGVSTTVHCEVRSAYGSVGGATLAAPGPAVVIAGTAQAPLWGLPYQVCVNASAVFPDGTTATLPPTCKSL